METQIEKRPQWTVKDVFVGQTLYAILLPILLTWTFKSLHFKIAAKISGIFHYSSIHTFRYAVLATILTVLILKFIGNWRLQRLDPKTAARFYAREKRFKWHKLYSIAAGCLICFAGWALLMFVQSQINPLEHLELRGRNFVIGLLLIAGIVLSVVVGVKGSKKLHQHMIRVTRTNFRLLQEVRNGYHNDKIPARFRYGEAFDDILFVLSDAQVYSVRMAVVLHILRVIFQKVKRVLMKVLGITAIIGILGGISLAESMDNFTDDMVQGFKASRDAADRDNAMARIRYETQEAVRKQKWHDAEQAKKQAQFQYNQARKATAYNATSYDAQRQRNLAKNAYWDWKKAEKDKYI